MIYETASPAKTAKHVTEIKTLVSMMMLKFHRRSVFFSPKLERCKNVQILGSREEGIDAAEICPLEAGVSIASVVNILRAPRPGLLTNSEHGRLDRSAAQTPGTETIPNCFVFHENVSYPQIDFNIRPSFKTNVS